MDLTRKRVVFDFARMLKMKISFGSRFARGNRCLVAWGLANGEFGARESYAAKVRGAQVSERAEGRRSPNMAHELRGSRTPIWRWDF